MNLLKPVLMLVVLFPASAWCKEVPVKDFFRSAAFEELALSPDGKHIAIVLQQEDRSVMAVLQTDTKKVVGKWDYGENRHFNSISWANKHRLLFHVAVKLGSLDQQIQKGDMYASDIDGTKRIDIPNGAYYQIVDLTPDDPDTILVQRSFDNAFLFKLNVNTGRTTTLMTAPVDYGSFVLDSEKKVRYAIGGTSDGAFTMVYRRDGDKWTLVRKAKREQTGTYWPIAMDADDKHVILLYSEKGEPIKVMSLDPASGEKKSCLPTQLSILPITCPPATARAFSRLGTRMVSQAGIS